MTIAIAEQSVKVLLITNRPLPLATLRELPPLAVTTADDVSAACSAVSGEHFDLLLLDLSLPGSDSLEPLREIRALRPDIPIVVLCTKDDESLGMLALEEGAQDYLMKDASDDRPLRRAIAYAAQRKLSDERLLRELAKDQRTRARMSELLLSARQVLHARSLRDAAASVLSGCRNTIGASAGIVILLAGDGQLGEPAFVDITDGAAGTDIFGSSTARRLYQEVIRTGEWQYENAVEVEHAAANSSDGKRALNILVSPLILRNRVWGLLGLGNKPGGFDDDDAQLAFGFGEIIAVTIYTEQSRTALELSEAKYRALFNNANDPVFLHDLTEGDRPGCFLEVNDVATQVFGYSRDEFLGMSIRNLAAVATPPKSGDIANRLRAQGHLTYDVVGKAKDGRLIPVEVNSHVFALQGKTVVLSVTRDITDRKRAEETLRQSEEHYRTLFDAAPIGIYRTTPDGRVEIANPALISMLGYETFEELSKRDLESEPVYGRDLTRAQFKEAVERDGVVRGLEAVWLRRDGSPMIVRESARVIRADDGSVAAYEGTVEDITEHRHAQEALEESAARERLVLRSLPMAPYTIQVRDGLGVVWMGDQVKDITGFEPSRFAHSHAFWSDRLHADDRSHVLSELGKLGKADDSIQLEYRWRCADGSYRWFFDQAMLARDSAGKPMEIIGNWLDITERKRAEENLRETVERLHRTLEGTIQAMAMAVETRDPYTAGHQRRVAGLAEAIAKQMTLDTEQVTLVKLAATIHDIGKIGVPAEILSRPGRISALEFRLIRSHPQVGYDILRTIEFPWPIADVVLQHHERLDGSGYPSGITGDEMMIEARVLAVADVVEAMASHRPYRPALGIGEALAEISRQSGTLYDAAVVTACDQVFRETDFLWP